MIYISSGFNKSHLILAASEFSRRGLLKKLFIGMYPTSAILSIVELPYFKNINKLKKLKGRGEVELSDDQVKQFPLPELLYNLSRMVNFTNNNKFLLINEINKLGDTLNIFSYYLFGNLAAKYLSRQKPTQKDIYLYRAGSGQRSVKVAKQLGMYTVCDHTIAHPQLVDFMTDNKGAYPEQDQHYSVSNFWKMIEEDMNQADHILVNSDFVKATCVHQGLKPENISVIYLGVDDQFLNHLPASRTYSKDNETLRFLFAGAFETRKGAIETIQSFLNIESNDWQLDIVGYISPDIQNEYPHFFKLNNVFTHGFVLRNQLAQLMSKSDVFIFPSLAEGSARVIFEAMASGCYIITTENAGSIVKNNIHGTIVPPGNHEELTGAINKLLTDSISIQKIGINNANLVREQYQQSHYGDQLHEFYKNRL